MEGRTTIIVSHNLLSVRDATRIIVLEDGRIAEQGTHEELLESNGSYARLYHLHQQTQVEEERTIVYEL